MNSTSAQDANRMEISARVAGLLTHYWNATEPAAVRQAQLRDWIEDLEEFPHALVGAAIKEYRRGPEHARRPLPGDIRRICIRRLTERKEQLDITAERNDPWPSWLHELWGAPPEGPQRRAEAIACDKARRGEPVTAAGGRAIGRKWAQDRGFDTLDAYAAANGITYEEACVEVCQSFLMGSPIADVIRGAAAKAGAGV